MNAMIQDAVKRKLAAALALFAAAVLTGCSPAPLEQPAENAAAAPALEVSQPWAAVTPAGVSVAAGYLSIVNNTDVDDTLVSVTSPRAPSVEVHEMAMEGAVMRMRRVERLAAPAHQTVALAPGGYHLMFMDIAAPFVAGESVPVTLTFENAGAIEVELPVRERESAGGAGASHGH
jgi:copper(I)-binding protein